MDNADAIQYAALGRSNGATRSTNVWRDFGYPDWELRTAKSQQARRLLRIMLDRGWDTATAAHAASVDPGWLTEVISGRFHAIPLDVLATARVRMEYADHPAPVS